MVGVEQWAEVRRLHFVRGLSQREIHRRTGLHRDTIRNAINSDEPPNYERAPAGSKLDPFKDEIHRLLREDPKLPGQRVRELIAPLGFDGGKTIVDDYLREVRPLFAPRPRTFQRTVYRPGEVCQFDLWEPRGGGPGRARPDAARLGRDRVLGLLARGRRRAGLLQADAGLAGRDRALPVVAGRAAADAGLGSPGGPARPRRPPDARSSPAFCGQLRVDWRFCEPADPQAKGGVERLQGFAETQLRARPRVRQRARLPGPARRLVRPGQRAHAQDAARRARSTGSRASSS